MALAQYSDVYWFPTGTLATNIPARVFLHSANTLATLWADAAGTVPLTNPLNTSATGRLEFWVEEGRYWVHLDSEAFEIAVGAAVQPATQQDILDEVARADGAYAALLHAVRHAAGGADPVTLTMAQITGLVAALAAKVDDAGTVTDNAVVRFDGASGVAIQNSTVIIGDDGSLLISGNLTDAGDLLVRDSNTAPAKGYRLRTSGGALDTEGAGADWFWSMFPNADFTGTQRNYFRMEAGTALLHVLAETQFNASAFGARVHTLNGPANTVGFHGAAPVGQATVTGSRGGNAALASLLTALAARGDIIDNTTA